jgi:hypothetical protein
VPRHIARLVVDYFAYVVRPGAPAHHAARRAACRRLLRLRCASGCHGTSRGSSRHVARLVVDYFTSRRLVVDYFASCRLVVD